MSDKKKAVNITELSGSTAKVTIIQSPRDYPWSN
jgi:hypothetical protein